MTTLTVFEIPTQPSNQSFTITLGTIVYTLTLKWNARANCWILDIGDQNNNPIVGGIPLITGADLLAQYDYLGFTGSMVAQTDNDPDAVPTYANLGSTGHLYYATQSTSSS